MYNLAEKEFKIFKVLCGTNLLASLGDQEILKINEKKKKKM